MSGADGARGAVRRFAIAAGVTASQRPGIWARPRIDRTAVEQMPERQKKRPEGQAMMRTRYGVMSLVRTGDTATPESVVSTICPLPMNNATLWVPSGP